jgi:hypothetical protein
MIMKAYNLIIAVAVSLISLDAALYAACPLDHFEIGRNPDGIFGTADDNDLFVDCSQIYRHSDPAHNQDPTWQYWHYPLYFSVIYGDYYIGEPGFDTLKADDPNHCLVGTRLVDYNIIVECVSITPGLKAKYTDSTPNFTLQAPGDSFNHSVYADPHLHMKYRAPNANTLYWITLRIYDALGKYQPSDEFSIVFVKDPLDGDVVIDGTVNLSDLERWLDYWLLEDGGYNNDFYYRCDMNRDGRVDLCDFAMLAKNWLTDAVY